MPLRNHVLRVLYRILCKIGLPAALLVCAVSPAFAATTWTGDISTDWGDAGNWTSGVPDSGQDTTIPTSPTGGRWPTIISGTYAVKKLTFQSGAVLNQTGGTLQVYDDFKTATDCSYNATGGTIQFAASGAGDFRNGTVQFYNVIVDSGVDPKFDGQSPSYIYIAGTFTNYNANLDDDQNKVTTIFNGTGDQTIYSAANSGKRTFGNLVIDKSGGTVTLTSNVEIGGDCTVTNGTLDTGAYLFDRINSGGTLAVNNSATLKIGGTHSLPTSFTTITLSSTSTVEYSGTAQTVAAVNYGHLMLSGSGTKTFAAGTTGIAGNMSFAGTATADAITNSTTIDYNGGGAQNVGAMNYYSLTLSNAGTKTLAAGTTGIAGTLTISGSAAIDATANSGTVDYNGSGAQTVAAINYHHLTLSNSGTKTFASGTTGIAGTFTINGSAVADATTNSPTIDYNGSGAQTVRAINYHHLTLSSAGIKTFAAGTTGIAGNMSFGGTATADATTNSTTIDYNGGGAQNVGAMNYYSLTLSNAGTKTLAAGTTGIAGTLTISGSATIDATANSGTVDYNGGGAQTVSAITYHHLTLSNAGTKTFAASPITIQGNFTTSGTVTATTAAALTINGNVNIANGTTFNAGSYTHTVKGNYSAYGTMNYGTSTIALRGTSTQTLTAMYSMNNLTIDNASGVVLGGNAGCGGTLTLTNGKITLGSYNYTVGYGSTISGASAASYLVTDSTGALFRYGVNTSGKQFPIGTTTSYMPVTVKTVDASGGGVSARVVGSITPAFPGSAAGVQATWMLSAQTIYRDPLEFTFQWNLSDEGPSFERTYAVCWKSSASWQQTGTATIGGSNPYTATVTGVTQYGSYMIAEIPPTTYYSKGSLDVSTASNWNTARDGSGDTPTMFGRGHTWVVQNTHAMTLAGSTSWDVSSTSTVQIESGGSWTNSSSGSVTVGTFRIDNGGTYSHSTTTTLPGTARTFDPTSTVDYSASDNQSVAAATYGHLILSNSGTKTFAASPITIQGNFTTSGSITATTAEALTINGNVNIANGTTFNAGSYTHTVKGNYSAYGTMNYGTSTISLRGTSTQTLTAAYAMNNLTIDNASGVVLGESAGCGGTLTLTSGKLTLGSYNYTVYYGATISGGSAATYLVTDSTGLLVRFGVNTSGKQFPIGTTTSYMPVTVKTVDASGGGVSARVVGSITPAFPGSAAGVQATWILSTQTIYKAPLEFTFQWNLSDEGASFERDYAVCWKSSGSWQQTGTATIGGSNPYTATVTGVTQYGSYMIAEVPPTTYYSTGSFGVDTLSDWNTQRDGFGDTPQLFGRGHTWVVQNAHAMTLAGSTSWDVSSTGTVEIESGGSWTNSSSGSVTIGTLHVDNGGTYSHATTTTLPGTTRTFDPTSTVDYSASDNQSVAAVTYGHLILSSSGTKTIADATTAAGNLTTSGTTTASCSGSLTVAGNVTIGPGTSFNGGSGTIDIDGSLIAGGTAFTATSGTLYVATDFSVTSGSFSHNSGTIVADGGDATITIGSALLNNLTVNKNRHLTLGSNLTVSGALNIAGGILVQDPSYDIWAGSISVASNAVLRNFGTGSLTLGGPVSVNGRIDFNGGGDAACTGTNRIQIRSSVEGTQRSWTQVLGSTITMVDVDVQDQAGTAAITCYGSYDSGNNGPNWTILSSCTGAPTAVDLISFSAVETNQGVRVRWQTGFEADNLGFHVYREIAGNMVQLTPSLIAGSALFAGAHTELTAGRSYVWWDRSAPQQPWSSYWLEDVDLNGIRTLHGPVIPQPDPSPPPFRASSALLAETGHTPSADSVPQHDRVFTPMEAALSEAGPSYAVAQSSIAAGPACIFLVRQAGWYRLTRAQLLDAGLSPSADPNKLQLFTEGVEQPIRTSAAKGKDKWRDPDDYIEFFGLGRDTPSSDVRTYWLVEGKGPGIRIAESGPDPSTATETGFQFTIQRKPRTLYFAALANGDAENFFGPVVSTAPIEEVLHVHHPDLSEPQDADLEVILQGVTNRDHQVRIEWNGTELGILSFAALEQGTLKMNLPHRLLKQGDNVLRLIALGGDTDVTLVDTVTLCYRHLAEADDDAQFLKLPAGGSITLAGFSVPQLRVMDVTNLASVMEVAARVSAGSSGYTVTFGNSAGEQRLFYVWAESKALTPASIVANQPSCWKQETIGADVILLTHANFMSEAQSLRSQHEKAGLTVALVDVQDVYDEYSFGNINPSSIKAFVAQALTAWKKKPRWLVLMGDASIDPRNYLGFDVEDYLPTRMLDTTFLVTPSDDWFADLDNDGVPELGVGRLPVRSPAEAASLVAKLANYRKQPREADWRNRVLLVADENDSNDFESASETVGNNLGPDWTIERVFRGVSGTAQARAALLTALNHGTNLVNYFGHGSINLWRGNLLTAEDAAALTNGSMLPLFVNMTCLNGFFADLYSQSLAEALLMAPYGGAAAVWASSGLTETKQQLDLDREVLPLLKRSAITLGQAVAQAKMAVSDPEVRKTWVLLGDPTLVSPIAGTEPADTTPPLISNVTSGSITKTSLTISWTTNEPADAQVEYGPGTAYGSFTAIAPDPQTLHSLKVNGLSDKTRYHFRVRSRDTAGNLAVSGDYTFTTGEPPDHKPPSLSQISVTSVGTNSAVVSWHTDEPADAQVVFGTTADYGQATAPDPTLSTWRAQILTGLLPGTVYHFRLISSDQDGNQTVSREYTFTTEDAEESSRHYHIRARDSKSDFASVGQQWLSTTGWNRAPASPTRLFVPLQQNLGTEIPAEPFHTAIVLVNQDNIEAEISFTLYAVDGNVVLGAGIINPVIRHLAPGGQLRLIDSELFAQAYQSPTASPGWILIESTTSLLPALSMTFDAGVSSMEGMPLDHVPMTGFVLPIIEDCGYSRVSFLNPEPYTATLRMDLMDRDGRVRASRFLALAARSTVDMDLHSDLFPGLAPERTDYLKVFSDAGVLPLVQLGYRSQSLTWVVGQDAQSGATVLYAPYYPVSSLWQTTLSVVNLDQVPGEVTLRLIGGNGEPIGASCTLPLAGFGKLSIEDHDFFGKGATDAVLQGYVEIRSSGIRLAGSIVLGDLAHRRASSSLPLVSDMQEEMSIGHVASNDTYFSQLMLLNPGPADASVTIDLFSADGMLEARASELLPAGHMSGYLVTDLFPILATQNRTSGYLRLHATEQIAAFAFIAAKDLSALAALPVFRGR